MDRPASLPQHVAIIMDGNRRWAAHQGLKPVDGHRRGADRVRDALELCREWGISYMTLYAFSAENWQRSKTEVSYLMDLLRLYIKRELSRLHKEGVVLRVIGDMSRLPEDVQRLLSDAVARTVGNKGLCLNIALSYGSRQELVQAAQQMVDRAVATGHHQVTQADLEAVLYTHGIPEPDLLIRTGGEQRLSNFLLWQLAYTELYFTPTLWPDFSRQDMVDALHDFSQRERRYGIT